MRVLFDHQVFSWQSYGGISRYFFEIAKGLSRSGHEAVFPDHFFSENVYLRTLPGIQAAPIVPFDFSGKKWLQERLGRANSLEALRKSGPDVFHPTYFGDYFLKSAQQKKVPFVITIHDMIHEKYTHGKRGYFSLDAKVVENKRMLAQKADAVVVVSENTRRDVLQYIPNLDPAKIHTIHHGNSFTAPGPDYKNVHPLPERYLLFVGQRGGYKNFSRMLEELADLLRNDLSLYLVCAGGFEFDATEKAFMAGLGLSGKVFHPVIRSDSDLSELYARAQCFIFPSRYEGFGFPVLEAFSCGCPCILNDVSSLPEVGGDAALYFNEQEEASLLKAVKLLLSDQALKNSLIERGYERARKFTWQNSVDKHLQVYQNIIESA